MSTEPDLQALWQSQPSPSRELDMNWIQQQSTDFAKTIRRRNEREWAAAAIVAVFFLGFVFLIPMLPFAQLACVLLAAAAGWVSWVMHRRGGTVPPPLGATAVEHLRAHQHNLERQRDLLHSIFGWYLAPFLPGLVVLHLALILELPVRMGYDRWPVSRPLAMAVGLNVAAELAVGVFVYWLNRRGARKLQADIDALNAMLPAGS